MDMKNKQKFDEEFLNSLIRHNVANKLQIIEGYLGLIKREEIPEDKRKFLDGAHESAISASNLIRTARSLLSKDIELHPIKIDELIKPIVNEYQSIAERRNMEIEYNELYATVVGHEILGSAFSNLIENSIKHSNGSILKIYGNEKEKHYVVSFEDDGIGIPESEREKIFERGIKGKNSHGTGFGTYAANLIVKKVGGRIELNEGELNGAKFDVYLIRAN
ncbi:MAG: HAMP domain-containing histidine kinase [Candidatus Aenigmarchaeota archaeon]|nr:HAMP domain-containing histidine kinase [Candidatus Aenigmarchaeota archaeon]